MIPNRSRDFDTTVFGRHVSPDSELSAAYTEVVEQACRLVTRDNDARCRPQLDAEFETNQAILNPTRHPNQSISSHLLHPLFARLATRQELAWQVSYPKEETGSCGRSCRTGSLAWHVTSSWCQGDLDIDHTDLVQSFCMGRFNPTCAAVPV